MQERVPTTVNHAILLDVLEPAIADAASLAGRTKSLPGLRSTAVTVNLALAPIADFVFPPLGVANVLLLVMLSTRHLLPAYRALANRRFNLDTLYICIGAATVVSYTFFGMALMIWHRD